MKKITILFLITLTITFGCKKSFLDVNQNLNQPTAVTPNVVLSAALDGSAQDIGTNFLKANNLMGYWSRSGNYVSDGETESYSIPNNFTDVEWAAIYNTLSRYDYIEKQGKLNNLPFYIGVAKTMKALHFSTLVDVYNDVPYSQAFDVVTKVQPKYDKGQDIYNDLVKQLDSAVVYFDAAKISYTGLPATVKNTDDKYDIMLGKGKGGSADVRLDNWVKFVNTVKLKLLLHEYRIIDDAYRMSEIDKIMANGRGFIGIGESATVNPGYAASTDQVSPFVSNFQTSTGGPTNNAAYYRANTYAVDFYKRTGDERQISYYVPVSGTNVVGNYDGDADAVVNTKSSAIGGTPVGTVKSAKQDQLIISDFESLFIQAEAAQRGWIAGSAKSFYESAVTQNFRYLNPNNVASGKDDSLNVQDAVIYLAGVDGLLTGVTSPEYVNWDAATDKNKLIITQKWAALNGVNWIEAWTDYRRTGFPTPDILGISRSAIHIQPKIPIRYLYPQTELNTNAANVPNLKTADLFNTPIFWNK